MHHNRVTYKFVKTNMEHGAQTTNSFPLDIDFLFIRFWDRNWKVLQ